MNALIQKRIRRRKGQRGAAMVEGAFMALIMCLLWNLLVYCAGLYLAKLESVYVVKYATFWYASHDCKGTPPGYKNPIFSPVTTLGKPDQEQVDQDCPNGAGNGTPDCTSVRSTSGFTTASFFASGQTKTKFTWSWQRPQWWATALSGQGTVHSEAYVMCNEGPYGIALWDYIPDLLKQIAGTVG